MAYLVVGLFAILVALTVAGVFFHIRVLMRSKPGNRSLLKRALIRHNWDVAAGLVGQEAQVDLAWLRFLLDWMFRVGGVAFLLIVIVAMFSGAT